MIKVPEKAFLLAAGFGKRLRPLTSALPKPLMPLWNRALIDHTVHMLKNNGVKQIVVNTHWLSNLIEEHIENSDYGLEIHISREKEILGTGGALARWRDFFREAPFWVVNGDIAASFNMRPLLKAYDSIPHLTGVCWVTDKKGPRTVELDYAGRVTCYRSPDPGINGTYTFCGAQLLAPRIFDHIKENGFSSLVEAYESAMRANLFLKGVNIPDSYWNDAGTIARYRDIHIETKRLALAGKPGGELYNPRADRVNKSRSSFFCVGSNAKIAAGAKGERSIVFDGVTLENKASLKNSVIQGGVINGRLRDISCVSGKALSDLRVKAAADAIGWKVSESAFAFLGKRGSDRSFWRGFNRDQRYVFVVDDGGRPENRRYAGHTQILRKSGVPVPKTLYASDDLGTLVLEDMGTTCLADKVRRDPESTEKLYGAVLKETAGFHRNVTEIVRTENIELESAFDDELYRWEHALFEEYMLKKRFGYNRMPDDVRLELERISKTLSAGCQMVIHRDLQSSNILFKGRRFVFIDYQGMRYGSPAYDIASLLYDPYVNIDAKLKCKLTAEYAAMMPECPDLIELFFKGAVERLIQSLGAFGRLSELGHTAFSRHILPALENLLEAADAADFNALGGLAEELIAREDLRVNAELERTARQLRGG